MRLFKGLLAGAILLSHTQTSAQTVATMTASAKKVLAARLVEPTSLQVRSLRTKQVSINGTDQAILCGEYNAKNRLGGYNGYKAFAYDPTTYKAVVTLSMGGRNGVSIGYLSEDGSGDFDSDDRPTDVLRAGVSPERLNAISDRAFKAAQETVARCAAAM
jgi:hypothetical protein